MKRVLYVIFAALMIVWAAFPQAVLTSDGLAAFIPSVGSPDINSGLTHHWRFDENTGTSAADSVTSGGVNLGFHAAGAMGWGAGRIGSAVLLNGGGAGLTNVASTAITTGTSYTVGGWFFLYRDSGNDALFSQDGNHAIYLSGQAGAGHPGFAAIDYFIASDHLSATLIPTNAFVHVAISVSGSTVKMYVNGVLDANTYSVGQSLTFTGIGSDNGTGSEPIFGFMDDFVVYNVVKTDAQIAALASGSSPTP